MRASLATAIDRPWTRRYGQSMGEREGKPERALDSLDGAASVTRPDFLPGNVDTPDVPVAQKSGEEPQW